MLLNPLLTFYFKMFISTKAGIGALINKLQFLCKTLKVFSESHTCICFKSSLNAKNF